MDHKSFGVSSRNVEQLVDSGKDLSTPNKFLRCPTEPRNTLELLQSPLHMKTSFKTPSKKSQLKRPLPAATKNITQCSTLITESQHGVSVPRHTMELLKSPLHKNVRSVSTSKIPVTPDAFQQKEKGTLTNRELDFNKGASKKMEDRIVTYLEQTPAFRAISKRGLRKMNVNDFVSIVHHLLGFTGVRLKPMHKENYIEQTIHAMQLLRYPHKVNKCWLLLPSASVHHWIPMFDFLLDFSPTENGYWISDLDFYRKEHDCLNVDHTSKDFQHNKKMEAESASVEENVTLRQELKVLELEILEQQQIIDLLEQQQRSAFEEETDMQTQLDKCQQELHALSQQSQQHDQQMSRLCIEIWRKSNLKE